MNRPLIAERFLQPEENLLMEIATLAKKTPNLIDLSIGDPDLITDATIIEAALLFLLVKYEELSVHCMACT